MHGCKPCPVEPFIACKNIELPSTYQFCYTREVSYLTFSPTLFSHKEFEVAVEEVRDAKEARGVFCPQNFLNPRNGELGHDST